MSGRRIGFVVVVAAVVVLVAVAVAIGSFGSKDESTVPGADHLDRSFTSSDNLTSRYHLFGAGLPVDGPVGLLVQFHGDGAFEFDNPASDFSLGGPDGIVAQGRRHDLLVLAVRSPDREGEVTWWENGRANADYAAELIEKVALAPYDIDTDDIWLVGYSGGAQFITQFFLPRHAELIDGGGSVLFGGGGRPDTSESFPDSLTSRFPMHWYTGARDNGRGTGYDALTDARQGSAWYRRHGFSTTRESPAGVGHDDLPFGEVVGEQLDEHRPA